MNAKADLVDGRSFTVAGLLVVDEKKLHGAARRRRRCALFRSGELHLISMHLLSLSNMQRLVDRMAQRAGSAVAPSSKAVTGAAAKLPQ